jgi:hypothetical protein
MHPGYCIWEFLIQEISISIFPKKFPNVESPLPPIVALVCPPLIDIYPL